VARARERQSSVEDLLRDMMIVQLLLAGIGQHQIRQIVGVDIHGVSRIGKKLIKKPKEVMGGSA
jgi:transposase-like protein